MTTYFGRVYQLKIGGDATPLKTIDGFPTASYVPPQIQFTIDQTPNAERSYGEITVYGLNKDSRKAVYERGERVVLVAGYEEQYSTLFDGSIENVEIGRNGPDSYVKIFCQSSVNEWSSATVRKRFGKKTPQLEIIQEVAGAFGLPVEVIGDFSKLPRALKGATVHGTASAEMRKLARRFGFTWFVENGVVVIAKDGAFRQGAQPWRYSAVTGLIGPPEITQKGVDITVLLNAGIRPRDTFIVEAVNQQLTFNGIYYQSQDFPETNGQGQNGVISLRHQGDYYGDTWETTIEGSRQVGEAAA